MRPCARGAGRRHPAALDAAQHDDLGLVGVVPRRDDGLEVVRLGVARRVARRRSRGPRRGTPAGCRGRRRRGGATDGNASPRPGDQLRPAVAGPRLGDRHPPAVVGDPHDVGLPRARLREHLEGELLVGADVATHDEADLGDDDDPTATRRPAVHECTPRSVRTAVADRMDSGGGGIRTPSMTWITPLLAVSSSLIGASLTLKSSPSAVIVTVPPWIVSTTRPSKSPDCRIDALRHVVGEQCLRADPLDVGGRRRTRRRSGRRRCRRPSGRARSS